MPLMQRPHDKLWCSGKDFCGRCSYDNGGGNRYNDCFYGMDDNHVGGDRYKDRFYGTDANHGNRYAWDGGGGGGAGGGKYVVDRKHAPDHETRV